MIYDDEHIQHVTEDLTGYLALALGADEVTLAINASEQSVQILSLDGNDEPAIPIILKPVRLCCGLHCFLDMQRAAEADNLYERYLATALLNQLFQE